MTAGGEIGGVDGEVAKGIAKMPSAWTLVPVVVDPAATIQYVLSGKADIAAGDWYRTAERAKVLGLSYPLYLDQMGLYSKDGVSTVAALMGKQVGTVSGFLWVDGAAEAARQQPAPLPEPRGAGPGPRGRPRCRSASTATAPAPMRRRRAATRAS